jgi:hypothetical protein
MIETRVLRRMLGVAGIVSVSIVLPACSSPGGPRFPWFRPFDSTNVARRPTYQEAEKRPFIISGYAGAVYGPYPARRFVADPSSAGLPAIPPAPSVSISHGSWDAD